MVPARRRFFCQEAEPIPAGRVRRRQVASKASCGQSRTGGGYQLALRPQDGAEGLEAQEAWRDLQEPHQGALGYYKLLASLMA